MIRILFLLIALSLPTITAGAQSAADPPIVIMPAEVEIDDLEGLDDDPLSEIEAEIAEELSGICPAPRVGEYWGINDSGNGTEIFRFNDRGEVLQIVQLYDVQNRDWEAITRENGSLFIGDFGDAEVREWMTIYALPEPDATVLEVDQVQEYSFRYADGAAHDCEAFFFLNGNLYLITKEDNDPDDEAGERSKIFRLDFPPANPLPTAQALGPIYVQGPVTDAAYSRQQGLLAVLTYSHIALYTVRAEPDLLRPPVRLIEIDFDQCEGICFDEGSLVITNEDNEIWKYPVAALLAAPGN